MLFSTLSQRPGLTTESAGHQSCGLGGTHVELADLQDTSVGFNCISKGILMILPTDALEVRCQYEDGIEGWEDSQAAQDEDYGQSDFPTCISESACLFEASG